MKKGRRKAAEAPGFQRSSRQPQIDMTASDSSRRQRGEPNKAILRTRKADQTEQAIMDAAISFFWNHSFRDFDVYQLMEVLLDYLRQDILTAAGPWLADEGDPVEQLNTSLHGLVHTAYRNGPLLRAISDAAATDARLESSWTNLLLGFDALVANKIQQHQKLKLIGPIDAHSVAVALNRMDAYLFIHHFGRLPRSEPKLVWNAIRAIWLSTLYGVAASDVP
jgi:hypothetical protein